MSNGKLHLMPVPLSGGSVDQLPDMAMQNARNIKYYVAERAKSARHFIKSIAHPLHLSEIEVMEIEKNNTLSVWPDLLRLLREGHDVALVSEAGMPCIADPGYELVSKAQKMNIEIVPYPGPNSMMMALMSSGLPGQNFCFHGYLPAKKEEARESLIKISQHAKAGKTTQIFMETPYRNKQIIELALSVLPDNMYFCIAKNLGTKHAMIQTKTIFDWKKLDTSPFNDQPTIFLISQNN